MTTSWMKKFALTFEENGSQELKDKVELFLVPAVVFFQFFDLIRLYRPKANEVSILILLFSTEKDHIPPGKPHTWECPVPHPIHRGPKVSSPVRQSW